MQNVLTGYRGLQLILNLNWDRLFAMAMIFAALFGGAFVIDAVNPPVIPIVTPE